MIRLVILALMLTVAFVPMAVQANESQPAGFVPITEAKLKRVGGISTLHINGQPKPFIAWAQYDTYPNLVESAVRAGIRIYQPRLIAGFQTAEFIENQMKEVLAKDKNAYFLPSMWVGGDQIYGFDKRDTAEYNTDTAASWNAISFGSQEWVNRVELQLRSNIAKLENSSFAGHILGYMILAGNTGEWFYVDTYMDRDFDRSLSNKATFRDWLKLKYRNDVRRLCTAWKDPNINFETAEIPAKASGDPFLDPAKSRSLVDYVQYHNERIADVTSRLASVIKQTTRRKKLAAIYSGYNVELGAFGPIGGQLCMEKMLASPDIDLIWSPLDYTDRGLDGFTGSHGTMDSIRNSGKLHVGEDDYATHMGTDHWGAKPLADDVDGSLTLHWRNFGYTLTKCFGQWWYDDSGYGNFNNAKMINAFKTMTQIADASVKLPRQSVTEIALVVDEFSQMVQSTTASASPVNAQLTGLRSSLSHVGAPYDVILLSDVLKGKAKQYKLLVMANAYAMDAASRRLWKQFDKRGKTVMWLYAAGYWNRTEDGIDSKSKEGMADLTGFPIDVGASRAYTITSVASVIPSMSRVKPGEVLSTVRDSIPFFYIADEAGLKVLARTDGKATCVLKKTSNGNAVWFGAPSVSSSQFYQAIARLAGVHIYSEKGRVVNANASFVFVTIPEASDETIAFRDDRPVFDIMHNQMQRPGKDGFLAVRTTGPVTLAYFIGSGDKLRIENIQPLSTDLARLVIRASGENLLEQSLTSKAVRTISLDAGAGKQLEVTGITPDGYYFYKDEMKALPTWSSDRSDVASVDANGYMRANQPGVATINAIIDGVTATVKVNVVEQPKLSIMNRVSDPKVTWSTWSAANGLHTFKLGDQTEYGTAALIASVVGEDGAPRRNVVRLQPLLNGEQVGLSLDGFQVPSLRGVKLVTKFVYPKETSADAASTLFLVGYNQRGSGLLSKQVEAKPIGKGTDIGADLSAFAGQTIRLDFLFRHKEGTPIDQCRIDLVDAYLTWDEGTTARSQTGTSFVELNKSIAVGGFAHLAVAKNYSDGTSEAWVPAPGAVWDSSRPDIAEVRQDGSIIGLKRGNALITLRTPKSEASGPLSMECFIHVTHDGDNNGVVKPMGLIASKPYMLLVPGTSYKLDIREITTKGYMRSPSSKIIYSIAQGNAVTMSPDGSVKALRPGLAVVQADMDSLRTQFLVEVRKPGQSLTWDKPFQWTIFERMPDYDYSKILAYRYSGLSLGSDK